MADRRDRHTVVDNTSQGWGVAAFITLLAILCAVGAWYIHNQTYRHPRYPTTTLEHVSWRLPAERPAPAV